MSPSPSLPPSRRGTGWAALAVFAALALPALAFADSITLTWTAPGDDGTTGQATSYELRYSDQPIVGQDTLTWWSNAIAAGPMPTPKTAGSAESFTVNGLTTGTTYYFVIRTSDEVPNVSVFSNVRARQAGAAALATPGGFTAQPVTGGVRLSWQEPASGGGSGYHFYRRVGTAGPDTLVNTAATGTTTWTDTSVTGGVTYEYRIATYQGALEGTPAVATVTAPTTAIGEGVTALEGYPNPAHGSVRLLYRAETTDGSPARARVTVFDNNGHSVARLLDDVVPAGEQTLLWLCQSDNGNPVSPGLYSVILDAPLGRAVFKIAVLP